MRPISEVLTAAHALFRLAAHPRADAAWPCLRDELEAWENELAIHVQYEGKPFGDTESRLAQVRHYLGRTEPGLIAQAGAQPSGVVERNSALSRTPRLDEVTKKRVLADERGEPAAGPQISQETARKLLEVCETAILLIENGDFRNGVTDPLGTIDEGAFRAGELITECREALALALAELAGEEAKSE